MRSQAENTQLTTAVHDGTTVAWASTRMCHLTPKITQKSERSAEIQRRLFNLHLKSMFFSPKLATLLHQGSNVRVLLPGSLSHIVQHTAPGSLQGPESGSDQEIDQPQVK